LTKGPPLKAEVCTPLLPKDHSGQASRDSQLSKGPLWPQSPQGNILDPIVAGAENSPQQERFLIQKLQATCASDPVVPVKGPLWPQSSQGDTLDPSVTGAENSPQQERFLNQKPKATCALEPVVPVRGPHSGQGNPRTSSGKPSLFRPGPQRYTYPADTIIHRTLIAAKNRLSDSAPYKSGRVYPFGTEPEDVQTAFTPLANGDSQLIETHQLYSDLTLQIVRKTKSGYLLTTQKIASPRD
jgi:hypothetical protein